MKLDYFWPRIALQITGIVFVTQILSELVAARKPGFEWVTPACGGAFALAVVYTAAVVLVNAWRTK